jgi:uncharacterized membrane protein
VASQGDMIKLKVNRMEALADGIFAIVMTIMLVSLSEIFTFSSPLKEADFYKLLSSLGDDFGVYVASFLILGILWFEHHRQFHFIKYVDPVLVLINIVWLMFVCLIPFSTMLLGNHPQFSAPVLFFGLNILAAFSFLRIHWVYAVHKGRLTQER